MNFKKLRFRSRVLLFLSLFFVLSSCIDDKYDLNKSISTQIGVLGDVTFPLGLSEPILLSSMIDTAEVDLLSLIDGNYVLSLDDSVAFSIDAIGGDDGITIDATEEVDSITELLSDDAEIPSFVIDVQSQMDINQNLSKVDIGVAESIGDTLEVAPSYPPAVEILATYTPAGSTYTNLPMTITLEDTEIEIDVDLNVVCPEIVDSVSNMKFGDDGAKYTIVMDISPLAVCFDDFVWQTPVIKLTFPSNLVLDNNTNVLEIPSTQCEGAVFSFDTWLKEYNEVLVPGEEDRLLPPIKDVIYCEVGDGFEIIQGTTNGTLLNLSQLFGLSISGEALTITDLTLAVSGIEIAIVESIVGDPIKIENLSSDIAYIKRATFAEGSNSMVISLDQLDIPEGLSIKEDADLNILFPTKFFDFVESPATTTTSEYTILQVPVSSVVGGNDVFVEELLLEMLTLGEDYPNIDGTIEFEPEIKIMEASVELAGSLTLISYNDYVATTESETFDISVVANELKIDTAEIVTNTITVEMADNTLAIEISEAVPAELIEIHSMTFVDEVVAEITIEVEGLPEGDEVGDLTFDNYTLSFPRFIKFAEEDIDENNQLVLNDIIGDKTSSKRTYTRTLIIEEFDFTSEEYSELIQLGGDGEDNQMILNDSTLLSGDIKLLKGETGLDNALMTGFARFSIPEISVARITGKVAPDIPEETSGIELMDTMDELALDEVSAVLTNPTVLLTVTNPLSIPMEIVTLNLIPYKDGVPKESIQATEVIEIAAGDDINDISVVTNITLSAYESTAEGWYQLDGLKNLLAELPDSILIDVKADVGDGEHSIDVNKDYELTFDYAVNVPLEFDTLYIATVDTITDLNESLKDIVDLLSTLELIIEANNALPFDVEIAEIIPLDIDGNVIELPNMLPAENTLVGGDVDSPAVSTITLHLEDNSIGDLATLDALVLKVAASISYIDGGKALSEEQFLQLGLKIRLPEGLVFDYEESF